MGTPALLAAQSGRVLAAANQSSASFYRRIAEGTIIDSAGSPSAVAGWVATITADLTHSIWTTISGTYEQPANLAASMAATFDSGGVVAAAYASIIVDDSSGTPALDAYWTAAAATAPLTDAEVTAALGHDDWARLSDVLVEVTGASAGDFTFDSTGRSGIVASGFPGDLATTEDAWNG